MGEVRAIRSAPGTPSELHAILDQGIARGATEAILIIAYPEGSGPDGVGGWEAFGTGGTTAAERAFLYQQLILLEIAGQEDE